MKKLFSIFCCLLLSASMVTQAQLFETVNKSPNGDILHKANLASGRNNAPTAIQGAWDYESSSAFNQTFSSCSVAKSDHYSYDNLYILSAEITDTYWLYLGFNVTLSNGKIPAGTYTVTKFSNYGYCEDDGGSNYYMWITYPANTCAKSQGIRGSGSGWRITPSYIESNSNTWCIQSGSVTINHVNNGCGYYVTTSSLKNYNGKSVSFTIGRDDYTYTITAVSSDNSLGSVSGGGSKKEGSNATLTANAAAGCSFVRWHDGNTDNPRTINVTGNATYTAYFVSNTAAQYTISTAVSPAAAGTVTGAGSYFENNPATLTATSANEHLYIFDHWLKDGNNYAGGTTITPTVTADATYTAVFRNAAAGTITGVADHGTISGTGNYAGGTAVQLGVTAADGYVFTQWTDGNTDNPRTVYVDGNATYTAQFVQGVAINVEMGRLGVYDSSDAATMNDGSSGNAWFHIIGRDGEYEVRFESYGKYFSAGKVYGSSDVDQSNSWIKRNGVTIPLNFNDISATATLNRTYGGKYGIYDISMRFVGTDGKIYMVSGQAVRAIYYDTADDYAFPKMDYNFNAPSFMSSIPEDYGPNIYTYTADGDGKWLYLKQSISGVDYYLRLCFKVAGNSIPTGTYQLNATGSGIPVGTAIPTILYDISTTKNQWPNEVNGSNVFIWGDDAYWWFLEYGTINVVNTNGVYYVEVDAINSFAEPVRFTMGTRPVVSYNLAWDANGGELSGTYTAAGSVNEGTSITAPTATRTGYTFTGWSPAFTGTMPSANTTYTAQWTANTYNVSFAANGGSGTMTDQVFTYGVAQNLKANTFTAPTATATYNYNDATGGNETASATVTATPDGWLDDNGDYLYDEGQNVINLTTVNGATIELTANWSWTEEITLPTPTKTGYEFNQWSFNMGGMDFMEDAGAEIAIEEDVEMTALWNIVNYTITYNGLEDETNSNPTSYNIESETITLVAPGKRSGYVFTGWTLGGSPITEIVSGSTGNKTLTATWEEMPSEIVLEDNKENSFYDTFKEKYDGAEDVTVVYNRQFPKSKWATLCLPFDVNSALLNSVGMGGRVYEFKKAEGNAETGINLYFATAATIKAGKGYIVNANAKLASKSSFRFPDVKINLESDKGDELNSQESYDALEGTSTEGNIELVGTLRKGRLRGVDGQNRYMGLKDNKIYYPNISTAEGSLILAYRGIFRSIEGTLNAERIRIVVDGEDMGELLIENDGRMTIDNDATRKFVKDGVLYIEREGVIYDAQGKRIK